MPGGGRSLMVRMAKLEREVKAAPLEVLQETLERNQKAEAITGGISVAGALIGLGAFMLAKESPETIYSTGMFIGVLVWSLGARLAIASDSARRIVEDGARKRGLSVVGKFLQRRIQGE